MKNKKIRNDIILIAAVILIAAIALTVLVLLNSEKSKVKIYLGGELYGEYPLDTDRTVEIISENGRNLLVIEGGKAKITEASCPDLVCVKHRAISSGIDQIICLPNKVVVTVE